MKRYSLHYSALAATLALLVAGCPPRNGTMDLPLPPPQPLDRTIDLVNRNIARVSETLRALCEVDGEFRDSAGVMRHYNLDGTLFVLPPDHFRFSLKSLGDTRFVMGTNESAFWFLDPKNAENNYCGSVESERYPDDMPIRPDQIVDALALRPLPTMPDAKYLLVQRVEGPHQQILFIPRRPNSGEQHAPIIAKEYWIETRAPDRIRRVLFRDDRGAIEMDAQLSDHAPLAPGGPVLPGTIIAHWPRQQAQLRIQIRRWTSVPEVTADSVQFETPPECPDS